MKKAELVKLFRDATQTTQAQAEEYLNRLGDIISAGLLQEGGGEVPIPGVGRLVSVTRAARTGRNPATGEAINIPARKAVKLNLTKSLKDALN